MSKKKKLIIMILMISLSLVFLAGCADDEEYDVYVTVYPVEYIINELSYDQKIEKNVISVKSVYPRGQDVHDYEPTPREIINIANSKALFYIGAGLEAFVENAKTSALKDISVLNISDYLNKFDNTKLVENNSGHSHGSSEEADEHLLDVHVWLDPIRVIKIAEFVYSELVKLFPEYGDLMDENYPILIDKLNELNDNFNEVVNSVEEEKRYIMVDHDAYQYWSNRYCISRIKLRNDSENSEVELKEFEEKIELAKDLGIKYILSTKNEPKCSFFNNYINELNATEKSLHHLATITNEEEKSGVDYISLMEDNLEVLKDVFPK